MASASIPQSTPPALDPDLLIHNAYTDATNPVNAPVTRMTVFALSGVFALTL
jgi:hypothetical protein